MHRLWSVLGSLAVLVAGPGTVTVLVPWLITGGQVGPPFLGSGATLGIGAALLGVGLFVLLDSFGRFAWSGLGTPAPVAPAKVLVVEGAYRLVRNPMYLAVLAMVAGEALLLASPAMLVYAVLLAAAFYLFVRIYEEPWLRSRFGADYEAYCARTPGWLPGLRPGPAPPPR